LDATLASVPVGLCFYDRELRIADLNETLARWQGLDRACVIGRPVAEIAQPEQVARATPYVREVFRTGRASDVVSIDLTTLRGEPVHWQITYFPVRDAAREVVRVGVAVVDVTAERRAVEYNEKFTAMLGHDLRNPLNAIATAAQLLQRRATT